jgi:hypothetical protein
MPYHVWLVVDPEFGERLARLPEREPVWVIDSKKNTEVAKRLRMERVNPTHLEGITTFTPFTYGADQQVLRILDTIDLHHGEYSADPPYSVVEVYGSPLTEAIERAFRGLGFVDFRPTSNGFIAERPTAQRG